MSLNPFFVRSILSTTANAQKREVRDRVAIPFSSGHSFLLVVISLSRPGLPVATPYSSGHSFHRKIMPEPIGWIFCTASQSLIGQVNPSNSHGGSPAGVGKTSLNPLFVRSILPTITAPSRMPERSFCLNPFFLRSILPTDPALQYLRRGWGGVAIPFSSGHSFQRRRARWLFGLG